MWIESAVANFFTPSSQKPKDRTTWAERSPDENVPATLLVAKYIAENTDSTALEAPARRQKIAAFDLVRSISDCHMRQAHPTVGFYLDHIRFGQAIPR